MYVDCSTRDTMHGTFRTAMQSFTTIERNAKYLVLVEDGFLANIHMVIPKNLASIFATYNIVYWCVTGFRRAEEMQYMLFFASKAFFMNGSLAYGFARAAFIINENIPSDPVTGRKPSYIVPEMVASFNYLSYAFARGSLLTDLVAVYLRRMYEAGLVHFYHRQYEQYLAPYEHTHTVVDRSLEFEHLMSVWICISLGWGISLCVFILEVMFSWSEKLCRRRWQTKAKPPNHTTLTYVRTFSFLMAKILDTDGPGWFGTAKLATLDPSSVVVAGQLNLMPLF
uniref:Uncharacterized protein n=1 Tax=Anopheles farauti TaxID=69004 RepID=A0A182Q948_9DIPT